MPVNIGLIGVTWYMKPKKFLKSFDSVINNLNLEGNISTIRINLNNNNHKINIRQPLKTPQRPLKLVVSKYF